jgi:hypothetical protein
VSPTPSQAPETVPPLFSWWMRMNATVRPASSRTLLTSVENSRTCRMVPAEHAGRGHRADHDDVDLEAHRVRTMRARLSRSPAGSAGMLDAVAWTTNLETADR